VNKSVNVTTPSEREIRLTREFDAPAQLVFDCHTKPELVKKWMMGPPGWSLSTCEIDLRVGGVFAYIYRSDADQQELGVRGEFREIVAPVRIVHTETMDGIPGESLETLTLKQSGATTTLTITMLYSSQDARDQALQSGIADGMSATFDWLERFLSEAKQVVS
jgi:uncharacterized protein YndB with AHSA1/START domain